MGNAVSRDAPTNEGSGVANLDSSNSSLLGLTHDIGSDALVQIESHEIVDAGVDGLKAFLVSERSGHCRHGWDLENAPTQLSCPAILKRFRTEILQETRPRMLLWVGVPLTKLGMT